MLLYYEMPPITHCRSAKGHCFICKEWYLAPLCSVKADHTVFCIEQARDIADNCIGEYVSRVA